MCFPRESPKIFETLPECIPIGYGWPPPPLPDWNLSWAFSNGQFMSSLLLPTNLKLIVIKSSMKSEAITQLFSFSMYTCYIWWLMHNIFFRLLTCLVVVLKNFGHLILNCSISSFFTLSTSWGLPIFLSCANHIVISLWLTHSFIFTHIPLQGGKVPVTG